MNATKPRPDEMQLDMLVDDELPEQERATVLRSLDATPVLWRDLAIRFMQRQVEHSAIRQMMRDERAEPKHFRFLHRAHPQLRIAAAFVITAGLAAGAAFLYSRGSGPQPIVTGPGDQPQVASFSVPSGPLTGTSDPAPNLDLPVKVSPAQAPVDLKLLMQQAAGQGSGSRHMVIMPNGQNGAVVFPVSTTVKEVVY